MKHATYLREALEANASSFAELGNDRAEVKFVPLNKAINIGLVACRQAGSDAVQAINQGKRLELAAVVLGGLLANERGAALGIGSSSIEALRRVDYLFAHAVTNPKSMAGEIEAVERSDGDD